MELKELITEYRQIISQGRSGDIREQVDLARRGFERGLQHVPLKQLWKITTLTNSVVLFKLTANEYHRRKEKRDWKCRNCQAWGTYKHGGVDHSVDHNHGVMFV